MLSKLVRIGVLLGLAACGGSAPAIEEIKAPIFGADGVASREFFTAYPGPTWTAIEDAKITCSGVLWDAAHSEAFLTIRCENLLGGNCNGIIVDRTPSAMHQIKGRNFLTGNTCRFELIRGDDYLWYQGGVNGGTPTTCMTDGFPTANIGKFPFPNAVDPLMTGYRFRADNAEVSQNHEAHLNPPTGYVVRMEMNVQMQSSPTCRLEVSGIYTKGFAAPP